MIEKVWRAKKGLRAQLGFWEIGDWNKRRKKGKIKVQGDDFLQSVCQNTTSDFFFRRFRILTLVIWAWSLLAISKIKHQWICFGDIVWRHKHVKGMRVIATLEFSDEISQCIFYGSVFLSLKSLIFLHIINDDCLNLISFIQSNGQ